MRSRFEWWVRKLACPFIIVFSFLLWHLRMKGESSDKYWRGEEMSNVIPCTQNSWFNYESFSIVLLVVIIVTVVGMIIGHQVYKDGETCRIQGGMVIIPNSTCDWWNSIRNECETVKCRLSNGSVFDL